MRDKKRLLVIHPALAPYRIDFFNSLDKHFDATFYFFNTNLLNQKFRLEELNKQITFECNYLKSGLNYFGRSFRFGIISVIRNNNPEIVLLPEFNILNIVVIFYKVLFKKKFKICTICDDNIQVASNANKIKKLLRFFQLKYLDGVILTHKAITDWYKKNLNVKCKLLVFPIIRNENIFFKQLNKSVTIAEDYRAKYQINNTRNVLFVGRLVEVKNLNRLIEAFKLVHVENKEATLIIVGSGNLESDLKQKVRNLKLENKVLFPGRYEGVELLGWYLVSDVFILPSISEPFGAVINEALLAGNYVLASKLAGGKSLLKENINGNTFNPYDVNEMASIILKTVTNTKFIQNKSYINESRMLIEYKAIFEQFRLELSTL